MKELVEVIARALVENPDEVVVIETEKDGELVYSMASHEVISPLDQAAGVFSLPDGTELHSPER